MMMRGSMAEAAGRTFDYVVVGDFVSADDYVTYRDHPTHQAFIANLIAGRVADRAAVQYELGD